MSGESFRCLIMRDGTVHSNLSLNEDHPAIMDRVGIPDHNDWTKFLRVSIFEKKDGTLVFTFNRQKDTWLPPWFDRNRDSLFMKNILKAYKEFKKEMK